MAAAWPDYVTVIAEGYGDRKDPDVQRTPYDDGAIRQEQRYTASFKVRRVTAILDSDQDKIRFEQWADAYAARWFAWADPQDGVAREVRVRGGAGGIEYTGQPRRDGTRSWLASLELEGLWSRVV